MIQNTETDAVSPGKLEMFGEILRMDLNKI